MKKSKTKTSKIVLVGGCFDILHYGHIHFLKKAKALGTYLIVALESDKNIKRLKGKNRPIHDQNKRREMLEALNFVDEVIILKDKVTDQDYMELVDKVRPCQIAVTKGDAMINKKREQAKRVGAKLIEIPKVNSPSTTEILKILKID